MSDITIKARTRLSERERAIIMRKLRKALYILLACALACALLYFGYFLVRYQLYDDYEAYLPKPYEVEPGAAFEALYDDAPAVPGYALAAQNDTLKLYANILSGEVAIYDRRNGNIVYSNPPDALNDPVARSEANKNYLRAQFMLDYYNAGRTAGTYDSYSMSVALNQMTAERIENGVRFIYEVGKKPTIDFYIPNWLSYEKFEEITSRLDEDGKKLMARMYLPGDDGVYALIKSATGNRGSRTRIDAQLQIAGFTEEDYYEQMALGGVVEEDPMLFTVCLEYRLSGDAVEVSVPVSSIVERGGGKVYRIQLLRFMGAAGANEAGYTLVPNGAGSLIYFNNGKLTSGGAQNVAAYSQYVYGMDLMDADYTMTQNTQIARLPLYAICREESALLATIERGATLAYLTSDVSGRINSYNYTYPTFVLRGYDKLSMFGVSGSEADMPILEKDMYDENITVRYTLLTDAHKGYSGVANYYRARLIDEGALKPDTRGGDIPFYYDVIGGVKQTAHFLGFQYLRLFPMTTFEQARLMAEALAQKGVANQVMNLQGWFNGGYYHDVADNVSVPGKLGGKRGLEALSGRLTALGGEMYADVAFQNVTAISKRYSSSRESSRYYGAGYTVILGQVNPGLLRRASSLGYEETLYNLLSPKFLPRYVGGFVDEIEDIAIHGVSLRDLGDELHADKRRTNVISREQALSIVRAQLGALSATGKQIMLAGGNAYALEYARHVIGAPMTDTKYAIIDAGVPFYQMLVHGSLGYAGLPLNGKDSDDWQKTYLKMIEYGASCRYTFTWQDSTNMKYTGLNRAYATTFSAWADEAARVYAYLNQALAPVKNEFMTEHTVLENGVARVKYSGGHIIYVNYSDAPLAADGLTVPARDYILAGGANA